MKAAIRNGFVQLTIFLFILLWVYTASAKLFHRQRFEIIIAESPLIAKEATLISWGVPLAELGMAFLLLVPAWQRIGMVASLIAMVLFSAYVAYLILVATNLPCACGGVVEQMTWLQHLVLNIGLSIIAGYALKFQTKTKNFIAINRSSQPPV